MSRSLLLLALLVLGAPLTARAAVRLQASATTARAGDVITFSWSGLPENVEEMELEYSVGGARWVRLSPELEGEAREYRWRSPAGIAGTVRVQLRHGRRHEENVGAEITLVFVADAQRAPGQGVRAADAWDLDRPVHGPPAAQWSAAAPAFSPARGFPALAVTSALELQEPAPTLARARDHARAVHRPASGTRGFESRRLSPLRN